MAGLLIAVSASGTALHRNAPVATACRPYVMSRGVPAVGTSRRSGGMFAGVLRERSRAAAELAFAVAWCDDRSKAVVRRLGVGQLAQ
jgi:hypothetical protein